MSMASRKPEVKELLAQGCTNQEIAGRLGISERTVKYYISRLLREYEFYGVGDSRRLIVAIVREAATRQIEVVG